jgi:hypothetical protein
MITQGRQRNNTIHASKYVTHKDIKAVRERVELEQLIKAKEKKKISQQKEEDLLRIMDFIDGNSSFNNIPPDELRNYVYQDLTIKEKVYIALNSNQLIIFFTMIVFITLFVNDLKYIFFIHKADTVFNIIYLICFFIYLIDIALSIWTIEEYLFGLYFLLDSIATLCMLFETDWIITKVVDFLTIFSNEEENYNKFSLEKSSRSSRIVITISVLRIIRLIRIVKLYKNFRLWESNKEKEAKIKELKEKRTETLKKMQHGKSLATIGKLSKQNLINKFF